MIKQTYRYIIIPSSFSFYEKYILKRIYLPSILLDLMGMIFFFLFIWQHDLKEAIVIWIVLRLVSINISIENDINKSYRTDLGKFFIRNSRLEFFVIKNFLTLILIYTLWYHLTALVIVSFLLLFAMYMYNWSHTNVALR